jgi:hypothetical protein
VGRFLKYFILGVFIQLAVCIAVWVLTLLTAPLFNPIFDLMFRVYRLPMYLFSFLGGTGESAMIATAVFGLLFGVLLYAAVFALIVIFFKSRR